MKKFITGLIVGAVLMISIGSFAETFFQFKQSPNTLYVDGKKVNMSMYNYQNTNYASIRGVATALGLDIKVTGTRIDFMSQAEETLSEPTPTPTPTPAPADPYASIKSKLTVVEFDGVGYYEFGDLTNVLYEKDYFMGNAGNGTFYLSYRDTNGNPVRITDGLQYKVVDRVYYFSVVLCEEKLFTHLIQ